MIAPDLLAAIEFPIETHRVGGGCISHATRVTVAWQGRRQTVFVKRNDKSFEDNFTAEADGLRRLATATEAIDGLTIPLPLGFGCSADESLIVLPWIASGAKIDDAPLGRTLARFHASTCGHRVGLERDNYLGPTKQINTPEKSSASDWPRFFAHQRLEPLLRGLVNRRFASDALRRDVTNIMDRLDDWWPCHSTSLLHGDLWSGNMLTDSVDNLVMIDPAVYYGAVEAELGMIRLFGGVGQSFWSAYQETNPLPGDWSRRVDIGMLYHLLNHMQIFGTPYTEQSEHLARRIAA